MHPKHRSETAWMMPETPEHAANCFGAGIGNPARSGTVAKPVGFGYPGLIIREMSAATSSGVVYRTRYVAKDPWEIDYDNDR